MLSKIDIFNELGKGLSIYPLNLENIKENSINVTVSEYAWTQKGGTVYWYGGKTFSLREIPGKRKITTVTFTEGKKVIFSDRQTNKKYLLLFPRQTTNVETLEVIGIGEKIGGAVHSKVGIVSKGIGDCGTMLGPGYCGHLLFSLHNITDDIIVLEVGETFGSLTFDFLKTSVKRESATTSSHYDRLLELKLKLEQSDSDYFKEDWKVTFKGIKEKMLSSDGYNEYKKKYPDNLWNQIKKHLCWRNVILTAIALIVVITAYFLARHFDKDLTEKIWIHAYNNGLVVVLLGILIKIYGALYKK